MIVEAPLVYCGACNTPVPCFRFLRPRLMSAAVQEGRSDPVPNDVSSNHGSCRACSPQSCHVPNDVSSSHSSSRACGSPRGTRPGYGACGRCLLRTCPRSSSQVSASSRRSRVSSDLGRKRVASPISGCELQQALPWVFSADHGMKHGHQRKGGLSPDTQTTQYGLTKGRE